MSGANVPMVGSTVPPLVGVVMEEGRRWTTDVDALTVKANLCAPSINLYLPVHYYGDFDSHRGPHFAIICSERLHEILTDELMNMREVRETMDDNVLQELWRVTLNRVFWRTELVARNTCLCGSDGFLCDCQRTPVMCMGTSAAVVVLAEKHIVAANCGDSRAVLYRGDRIIQLTFDHKPDRADEKARIEAKGGRIIYRDVARVQGILDASRSIGDLDLKSKVISEPEVTITKRDKEDEFLILASDGIWDVIPYVMACRVVHKCLKETVDLNVQPMDQESSNFSSRSAVAAVLLGRLAKARGSVDNISVVVIDLRRNIRDGSL